MKIEKLNLSKIKPARVNYSTVLRALKREQVLRITTAREAYLILSRTSEISKKRNIKFRRQYDGDDVLIFIKP